MSPEEQKCLDDLEKACQELTKITDLKQLDQNALFSLLQPIIQNYRFIVMKFWQNEELLSSAMDAVLNMKDVNPALEGIVDTILNSGLEDDKEKADELANRIFNLAKEFEEKSLNSSEEADEYETLFNRLAGELAHNIGLFQTEDYNSLMELIGKELAQIEAYKKTESLMPGMDS